jgi:hypothetical protein
MPSLYDEAQISDAKLWSPFVERRFVDVASAVMEASPQILSQCLCSEGISRSLWKQMGLPDATAPPNNQTPYTENELMDLYAAISDRAKASLSPERGSICDTRLPDDSDRDVVDMQALNTFYGTVSPLSLRVRSRGRHASRNEAGPLATGSSSPRSPFSSRRSSLDKPAPMVESRKPSSHVLIRNGLSATDITPPSRFEITPLQVETPSPSDPSPLEAQPLTAGQPTLPNSQRIEEEAIMGSAKSEQFQVAAKSKRKMVAQSARSYTGSQNTTLPSGSRKHSSDESQETNESMQSKIQSSTNSGSTANQPSSVASADELMMVEQQYPATVWERATSQRDEYIPGHGDEADTHDMAIFNKRQCVAGTPKPPKASDVR